MVSINAGLLMYPDLTIKDPYLKGASEMYEGGVFVTVDLRFLVDAHVCVFEDVSSYGRYLCFNHVINCNKDADQLSSILLPPSSVSSAPQSQRLVALIFSSSNFVVPTSHGKKVINYLILSGLFFFFF